MKLSSTSLTVLTVCLVVLFKPVYASGIKWKNLKPIEKTLLSEHKANWKDYHETKRTVLHNQAKKKAKRLKKYQTWIKKHLSIKERRDLRIKFKKMNRKQFKRYMDGLFKKYGRPA